MIPRLGDGNLNNLYKPYDLIRLENDSPSRGRKLENHGNIIMMLLISV